MQEIKLGEKLQALRKKLNYTQKDFAEFLGVPQPSLSAYENNRNSPTMEVLINIASKCNVSLDWLCGLSATSYSISTLGDISTLLYNLLEINEIGIEIEIHDHLTNDLETETDKWYTQLRVYGNDSNYKFNKDLCKILREIYENITDLETYGISTEIYDMKKSQTKKYYSLPITQKKFPELSREERIAKHIEYLKSL